MNSRERLLAAIKFEATDRVPISTYELVGFNSHSFENKEPSYKGLMDFIRLHTDCVAMWNPNDNRTIALTSYPADIKVESTRVGNISETRRTLHTSKGKLTSTYRVVDGLYTTWHTEQWCKTPEDVSTFLSIPYEPLSFDVGDYKRISDEVGDNGIIMASIGDPALYAMELMEFGEATVWAMTETDHFAWALDEIHRRNMENIKRMLDAQAVDLYRICGPEYITPPYLPPDFFKRFVTPYVTEIVELIHRYDKLVRIHSHGRIGRVLDDIISSGADAVDPCESPPDGDITLQEAKARMKGKMCLFGNIQLKLLEHGSSDDIRKYVRCCMREAKDGGGYVIMPTAAPINVPLSPVTEENYKVFIDTALEEGVY